MIRRKVSEAYGDFRNLYCPTSHFAVGRLSIPVAYGMVSMAVLTYPGSIL